MAQTVSDVAQRLNRRHARGRSFPPLLLMTDSKRLPDPSEIIPKLPKGSAVIVRGLTRLSKIKIINKIKPLCSKYKVKLLVSDDVKLALSYRLDGVHFSEQNLKKISACGSFPKPHPGFFISSACHSQRALHWAETAKVDAVLISPVFETQSHPIARILGRLGFQTFTNRTKLPCYALGGITQKTAQSLINSKACGFAGISSLL